MSLAGVPLLLIPFAIYNIVAFLMPGLSFATPLIMLPMPSQAQLAVSIGDILVMLTMLILFIEILRMARAYVRSGLAHGLAIILFLGMVAEFVLVERVATSTFLLLVTLSFVDVLAGFAMALRSEGRPIALERIDHV